MATTTTEYKVYKKSSGEAVSVKLEAKAGAAASVSVSDLRKAYSKQYKINSNRLEFREEGNTGEKEKTLDDADKVDISKVDRKLFVKDLGPQVGYRTVFVVEYLGPLLIVLLFYLRPSSIYSGYDTTKEYNPVAKLGLFCWLAHFLKREFETFFVHKFSRPWMPRSNIFKNCGYYWSFATFIGYFLCHPDFIGPQNPTVINFMDAKMQINIGLGIFVLCEVGNLICHIMLSNMRDKEGSKERNVPKGFLFDLVACPNYTFEIIAWVGFSIMTNILFSWIFTAVGFYQMSVWANQKHQGYLKSSEEYKKLRRKRIIPFIY
jgi:very-long-chain enoyl-CoA reductase